MKNFIKILILICLVIGITACGKPKVEDIKAKMETHLQEKYGESFVVENIGMRDANGQKFYTAKIYPKAIMGTDKEDDSDYYATVNIDILAFGRLAKTGDTYGEVKSKEEAENYLLPKVKELFGDRVRLKVNPELEVKTVVNKKETYWLQYITPHFKVALDKSRNDSSNYRLKIDLVIYVFDKIDDEKEKEERRKQLFELLQYMRKEKLDTYLELYLEFPDDIILAPSFRENRFKLEDSEYIKEKKEIEKKLREEVRKLGVEEYTDSINRLKKSDITVSSEDIYFDYIKDRFLILTMEYLKIDGFGRYDEAKENNTVEKHLYKNKEDLEYKEYKNYIFNEEKQ